MNKQSQWLFEAPFVLEDNRYRDNYSREFEFELESIIGSVFDKIGDVVDWGKSRFILLQAITGGNRDENQLTNLVFFSRHPELQGGKLVKTHPNYQQLSQEWLEIRNRLVRPVLKQASTTVVNAPKTNITGLKVDTPLPKFGAGFYSYSPTVRQYGLPATIRALMAIGAAWQKAYPQGPRIGIGDISLKGGGNISGHASHEKGVDIDIRAMPNDGKEKQVWAINWFKNSPPPKTSSRKEYAKRYCGWLKSQKPGIDFTYTPNYSQRLTQELVNIIQANGILRVEYIFFNDPAIKGVRCWPNHNNHLHIRFFPPGK